MQFFKKNLERLVIVFYLAILPIISFAQNIDGTVNSTQGKIVNPLGQNGPNTVMAFIEKLLKGVIQIGMPVVALAIIYCGFLFVAARGNSEKLGKAKGALLYTLIGAALLLGSWALAQLISNTVLAL